VENTLSALLLPDTGTSLHTIAARAGLKILASVNMRPGDGINLGVRRGIVAAHDIVQVSVHADIPDDDGELPTAVDFHAPTLLWTIEHAEQLALWCESGTNRHADVAAWMVNSAQAGSRFQTTINATPEHAAHWLAYLTRWKRDGAELRVFGREVLQ
jgi:hypothetical protein